MTMATTHSALDRSWPEAGVTRVPFWAYTDPQVYEQEMRLIFCGESWAYVGLEVEIPQPGDFSREEHGLTALQTTVRHGVVFASFSTQVEPFADYLGPTMLTYFDRVFAGRALRLLGYTRQQIPSNWKLMFENIKDPYHASLMHVFLVTFGLFRADQSSAVRMDATGRHACLISRKGEQRATSDTADIRNLREDFTLHDPCLLAPVREFPGDATVVLQTLC